MPVAAAHFDHLTRTVSLLLSRRSLAVGLGLSVNGLHSLVDARKKRRKKRKKRKITRNDYDCVNVGDFCKDDGQCCSGICQGKKPKKGKKDRRRCVAHNVLNCPGGADYCAGTPTPCGTSEASGSCIQTTGQASFCSQAFTCGICTMDADCVPVYGASAACIVCTLCPTTGGTACAEAAGSDLA